MSDFFRGWRRKCGCITLVMATLLSSGWIRSHFAEDDLVVTIGNTSHISASVYGGLHWVQYESLVEGLRFRANWAVNEKFDPPQETWGVFDLTTSSCSIPYWTVVIPLTLLSAYLILREPRKQVT